MSADAHPEGSASPFHTIQSEGRAPNGRGIIMYVRFVTPLIDPDARVECGFFRSYWYVERLGAPEWLMLELRIQFAWFNDELDAPGRVVRHFRRRRSLYGVCWFRSSARECISRARYCAWLISEAGLPVEAITAHCLRETIWQDDLQVVAPARMAPRVFDHRLLAADVQ